MSHPVDVQSPCLPSSKPPGGGSPRGISPEGGLPPMSLTQKKYRLHHWHIESTLCPPISPFSLQYPLHFSPLSLIPSHILLRRWPVIVGGWQNAYQLLQWRHRRQRRTIRREDSPQSVPPSLQQPTPVASSLTRANTYLRSGVPDWVPPVGQTCNNGVNGGGIDYPPPGLICSPESVGGQSASGGFSVITLTPGILPHGNSTKQVWW